MFWIPLNTKMCLRPNTLIVPLIIPKVHTRKPKVPLKTLIVPLRTPKVHPRMPEDPLRTPKRPEKSPDDLKSQPKIPNCLPRPPKDTKVQRMRHRNSKNKR